MANNNQTQTVDVVAQLAAGSNDLFTPANYANAKATKVEPAVRINAPGCGWGSVPAKAIALVLSNPEQAKAALIKAVEELRDPAKVKSILDAKRAKIAGKGKAAPTTSTDLDDLVAQL